MKILKIRNKSIAVDGVFFHGDMLQALVYDTGSPESQQSTLINVMTRRQCEDCLIFDNLKIEYLEDFCEADYLREFRQFFIQAINDEYFINVQRRAERNRRDWLCIIIAAVLLHHAFVIWLLANGHYLTAPVLWLPGVLFITKLTRSKNLFY